MLRWVSAVLWENLHRIPHEKLCCVLCAVCCVTEAFLRYCLPLQSCFCEVHSTAMGIGMQRGSPVVHSGEVPPVGEESLLLALLCDHGITPGGRPQHHHAR